MRHPRFLSSLHGFLLTLLVAEVTPLSPHGGPDIASAKIIDPTMSAYQSAQFKAVDNTVKNINEDLADSVQRLKNSLRTRRLQLQADIHRSLQDTDDSPDALSSNASSGIFPPMGIEYLGAGYDYIFGNPNGDGRGGPDPGFKGQVLKLSSDIQDLCPDFLSLCPKGAYVRRLHMCDFASSSTQITTETDLQRELSVDASLAAGYENDFGDSVEFTASVGYNKFTDEKKSSNFEQFVTKAQCREYAAFIQPGTDDNLIFTTAFIDTVNALPAVDTTDSQKRAYDRFVQNYGTHILDYIEYGAKYIITTSIREEDTNTLVEEGINVAVTLAGSTMSFTGSAQFSYENEATNENTVNSKIKDVSETVVGGYVPTGQDDNKWNDWMSEIATRPFPVRYTFRPIDALAGKVNQTKQAGVKNALIRYASTYGKKPDTSLSTSNEESAPLRNGVIDASGTPIDLFSSSPYPNLQYFVPQPPQLTTAQGVQSGGSVPQDKLWKVEYGAPGVGLVPFMTPYFQSWNVPIDDNSLLSNGYLSKYSMIKEYDEGSFSGWTFNMRSSRDSVWGWVAARTNMTADFRGMIASTFQIDGSTVKPNYAQTTYMQASYQSSGIYYVAAAQTDPVMLLTPIGKPDYVTGTSTGTSGYTQYIYSAVLTFTAQGSNVVDNVYIGNDTFCPPLTTGCPLTQGFVATFADVGSNTALGALATYRGFLPQARIKFNVLSISRPLTTNIIAGKVRWSTIQPEKATSTASLSVRVNSTTESGITVRRLERKTVANTGAGLASTSVTIVRLTFTPGFVDAPSIILTPVVYQPTAAYMCQPQIDDTNGYTDSLTVDVICSGQDGVNKALFGTDLTNENINAPKYFNYRLVHFNFGIFGTRLTKS